MGLKAKCQPTLFKATAGKYKEFDKICVQAKSRHQPQKYVNSDLVLIANNLWA